ncbi:hypothetical protein [Marinicrinis sediminis]|uniref:Phage gp6-like head-tail connector protein n=1 Tax=Marinicrinis sediminis TaxID=1652465 RepID=A0ABW5RFK1_9BACL
MYMVPVYPDHEPLDDGTKAYKTVSQKSLGMQARNSDEQPLSFDQFKEMVITAYNHAIQGEDIINQPSRLSRLAGFLMFAYSQASASEKTSDVPETISAFFIGEDILPLPID